MQEDRLSKSYMEMQRNGTGMVGMSEFQLPQPESRLVVYGDTIFKLRYRMSQEISVGEELYCENGGIQKDLQVLTAVVLKQVMCNAELKPVRTDNVVVYPGTHTWTTAPNLLFMYEGKNLKAYSKVIFLLVHLAKCNIAQADGVVPVRKRKLPVDDERLTVLDCGVPSGAVLTRKQLRLDSEKQPQIPCNRASLPVNSAQMYTKGSSTLQRVKRSKTNIHSSKVQCLQKENQTPATSFDISNETKDQNSVWKLFSYIVDPIWRRLGWK